ncbi:hypothetical protein NS228_19510 [Methylobacterium indicum]|uniref:hypothetical protein n=1 Tax=Methylobacterium TaxID=407 RepID=UPI000734297D|nr:MULTISPECIES: hypothetical protein [Methylobacterium]KTS37210.1 hypothetical protein NS228_19510 [Methylobacterium indicum]KTS37557.1 hypothetical protein NS229_06515 [Methylobacterium indicum]KTS54491.1 hypothetical protein NS230_01270 [Methylobacterium indicum]
MGGRSVSGDVDESVAVKLGAVASADAQTPASIVGRATSFYVNLPEAARSALRRLEQSGTPDERRWFEGELMRLLLKTNFSLTQRMMAAQAAHALPADASDAAIDAAADEWMSAAEA